MSSKRNLFGFANVESLRKVESSMHIIDDLRISPFLPIDKVTSLSKIWKDFKENNNRLTRKTSWGEIEIRNRILTQHHLEVFSVLMVCKRSIKEKKDGKIIIYFSLREIAGILYSSKTWGKQTSQHLEEKLQEIADTRIIRKYKNGDSTSYSIIEKIAYSKKEDMWGIILSDEYSKLFKENITINFAKRIDDILKIKGEGSGLIKAIIHHFITHQNTNSDRDSDKKIKVQRISLIQLLETVGANTSDRQIRSAISALNKNKEILESFSITFHSKDRRFEFFGTNGVLLVPALSNIIK